MSIEPVLSVIIPCHNHARFLAERIGSILAQTMPFYEAIFLDDGSTDDSFEVARSLAGEDPRFRFLRADPPTGSPFAAWRLGLAQARAVFVWIAESDDACEPTFLEALLPLLQGEPGLGMVYCQSQEIDADSRIVGSLLSHTKDVDFFRWRADYVAEGREECRRALLFRNTIPNASACLFRREALAPALAETTGYALCGDWAAYVELLSRGWGIAFQAVPRNRYRCHPASQRDSLAGRGVEIREMVQVKRRLKQVLHPTSEEIAMSSDLTLRRLIDLASRCTPAEVGRWFNGGGLLAALTDFDPHFCIGLAGAAPNRHLTLDVYAMDGGHFHEGCKVSLSYAPNVSRTLALDVPAGRLRIDPSQTPGLLRITSVILSDAAGCCIAAFAGRSCEALGLAGSCFAIACDADGLLLYAYGNDPIVLLPSLGPPGAMLRLEIILTGYSLVPTNDP